MLDGGQNHLTTSTDSLNSRAEQSDGAAASLVEIVLISLYLLVLAVALISALLELWPVSVPAAMGAPTSVSFFIWTMDVSDEVRLLLLVVFTGALGGLVHALRSLAWYIGERQLKRSWLLTYVTQPFVGAALAFIFYLVIRGGFFSPQASFAQTSPFGFAAMAGLIGMFSPQAVLKLKEVAETILTKPPAGKDTAPPETIAMDGQRRQQAIGVPGGTAESPPETPAPTRAGTSASSISPATSSMPTGSSHD